MTTVVNDRRRGFYLDSVALMRLSRTVAGMAGVVECGMMMGTPANKRIMADAGVLDAVGEAAGPGDLVIAIAGHDAAAADAALAAACALLDAPKSATGDTRAFAPRTLRAALAADPAANLALISVPGAFAAAEARKALNRGLNVLMFSDNVPLAEEVALKQLARVKGLLMMGPDCGTAIIGGTPLGFANVVPRGDIGIVGASGTGIQEVSCLIANNGGGISHAIGVGGRDLKAEVGGITMLMAIDLLDADPATKTIVIISKPPAESVAKAVLDRVAKSKKRFAICFLGGTSMQVPKNAKLAPTLEAAADLALGRDRMGDALPDVLLMPGKLIRGLYAGGTLAAEAQVVLVAAGLGCASNAPIPGAAKLTAGAVGHALIDLGDDDYTQGRPHPMIDPSVRDEPLRAALADTAVGVVLIDVVLGRGAHADPASFVAAVLGASAKSRPLIVATVTGTSDDPQDRTGQRAILENAGVVLAQSNAEAARLALRIVSDTVIQSIG